MMIELFVFGCGVLSVFWSDKGAKFFASEGELLRSNRNWKHRVLVDCLVKKVSIESLTSPVHNIMEVCGNAY